MKVLSARLLEKMVLRLMLSMPRHAEHRWVQVTVLSGSEPTIFQNRVTDHRINLTLYKLDRFVEGDLQEMLDALNAHLQEKLIEKHAGSGI